MAYIVDGLYTIKMIYAISTILIFEKCFKNSGDYYR